MDSITHISELISELKPVKDSLVGVSYQLMTICAAIAFIVHQYTVADGKSDVKIIVFKLIGYLSIFSLYNAFFVVTENIALGIASEILPAESFKAFFNSISQGMKSNLEEYFNVLGVIQSGISGLLVTLTYIIASVAYKIIIILKILILGIFYITGPFIFALSILPGSGNLAIAWVKNVISISCWPIIMNILLLLQKTIGLATFHAHPENFIPLVAANITFTFTLLSTPVFSAMLVYGLSSAASSSTMSGSMYKYTYLSSFGNSIKTAGTNKLSNKVSTIKNTSSSQRRGIDVKK